ncbi:Cytochrome c-type biogenesis protein CcmF [Arcanobacterium haemolyticum]|uniref:Cytochrome c-type biogenesis protein CcsB n=1 Tax=Arcanobacterium haemolyticum (strain ATCC 9345 / DSM 20595 / CCM 5947 / CCUG 17215 / LMG 16163 / NBRC 15585 / NCTC 8452 / 11018) TaxID=644284 RepID=D7BKJ2_ARCHD|nr:c-type cytochrome biogenesis protein CcsB [Arcanobacterium haemolyticum]ADH93172.1 cytochrome c-type biogenesis protein CcsB [Arcanobacterium haemolyticum DSM 20595]SPT74340.1 Cytochrome c-type biogenesis protein CcmF [Arcanobacterium haemolyticum]SQH28070.1 Cytochrome c-type biogenesis protein CcmF [Arcanobacterium haemolyticum]
MLEYSQILLFATTLLVALAFVAYVLVTFTAWRMRNRSVAGNTAVSTQSKKRGSTWYAGAFVILAFVALTLSMVLRWVATGKVPLANQYEFATSFSWGMLLFQVYFDRQYRVRTLALFTLPVILAMLIYITRLSYENDPLMPALQNSPLLTLHVFTAALSYGAAVVGFGAALMYLLAPKVTWRGWPKQELLDEIAYKAVVITFPLLTIMIILGSIWANIAWGRYWAWDPKETAALVTWLIYGAYLHARVVRDWRGTKAAWLLVIGFIAIIFTFFGNYWFGGLHSYA